jgi:hypothetical protein
MSVVGLNTGHSDYRVSNGGNGSRLCNEFLHNLGRLETKKHFHVGKIRVDFHLVSDRQVTAINAMQS